MYIKIDLLGNQLPDTADNWVAVLDTNAGLMWEAHPTNKKYKWFDINQRVDEVNQVGLCDHHDWRVPTIEELKSLVKEGATNPSIDTDYFPNTLPSYFWSSSPDAGNSGYAWIVDFNYGYDDDNYKSNAEFARVVRGDGKSNGGLTDKLMLERDMAIALIAEWCVAIDVNGTEWDDWDKHYKKAMWRAGPLRQLLDTAIAEARAKRERGGL